MPVHVCFYCCSINYSLPISTSLWIFGPSLRISYSSWRRHLMSSMVSECERTMTHHRLQCHTSRCLPTPIDQLLSGSSLRTQCVSWWTELSAVQQCWGLWQGFNQDWRGFHYVGLTGLWTAHRLGSKHQCFQPVVRSSGGSHSGPEENKGVRLQLFSVSVPWGIKGGDIFCCPAWLGPAHLRGPVFLPRSLQALFTHPGDMACRRAALLGQIEGGTEQRKRLTGRKAAERTNSAEERERCKGQRHRIGLFQGVKMACMTKMFEYWINEMTIFHVTDHKVHSNSLDHTFGEKHRIVLIILGMKTE